MQKPEAVALPTEYISAVHETNKEHIEREASEDAEHAHLNPYVFDLLVERESDFSEDAVGDNGLARNCAQFHEATFDWMKEMAGMPTLQYANCSDQLKLMSWAMSHHLQSQWGTYDRLDSRLKALL